MTTSEDSLSLGNGGMGRVRIVSRVRMIEDDCLLAKMGKGHQ